MSAASKLDLFANVSLHHHYICNPISQTALPVVDNVKFLGVGVEQGQDFQRHKGVSFQTFQALYMFIHTEWHLKITSEIRAWIYENKLANTTHRPTE